MFINLDQVFFYCARYCFDLKKKIFDKISLQKTKYSLFGLISSGAYRLNMNNKIGDSSLQLSFSFDDKKNRETSFQMDPGSVSSASSERSVSWSEGGGSAEDHIDKDASFGQQMVTRAKRRIRKSCTTKLLKRRLPIIEWLPKYTIQSLFHDCMAGFTVALTAIPQGIAYGAVAGVPVEFGLYTAFAGPFIYALLGSVSQITMGPTAVMALMTHQYVQLGGAPYAIILSFVSGCIELLAGLLNLGFIMDFISAPVISGFCSAAAVTVILSQFKTILGLSFRGSTFTKVLPGIFKYWRSIRVWDAVLGFVFIAFLMLLKNLTLVKKWFNAGCCLHNPCVEKALWFVSTCRNALAVILGCVIAYVFEIYGNRPFQLLGEVKCGIPNFQIPPFSFERPDEEFVPSNWTDSDSDNQTSYDLVTFPEILKDMGPGMILVPVIAILEQVAIAKAFSNGAKTDSTQEMIAVGAGSIFCSFFGCIPLTASFSRSSVLSASGGKTQFASLINGCVVLFALAFLMPTFYFIPKSILGAVIITAVYPMIEYHEIPSLWRGRRIELFPFITTFLCCLLINMEYGILIGAQMHLLMLAYEGSRSKSTLTRYKEADEERVVLQADRNLYFPSVERFRNALTKVSIDVETKNRVVVLDMGRVNQIDHTTLKMLQSILAAWDKKEEKYCFANVSDHLKRVLSSILPKGVPMSRPVLPSTDTTISFVP
ncbi:sodium-independent sulfate anion transporter-like isoform X1 [Daphnia carinata]|uniref:sodium-independent sulfate anion transporter-like isoform X1 n=1 Tax=Daphnia carinata TaxID=120202 RepID=UPI002868C760|nr:sodium-independent sulfate anion transporter-like isoform X1 [Daphnia carinata]